MTTLAQMVEQCGACDTELEIGQIGLCDECQGNCGPLGSEPISEIEAQ